MTVFAKPSTGNWKDTAPLWVKENRRPTRQELAAKHFADGGTVGPATPVDTGPSFFDIDEDTGPIPVKRYNR